MPVTKSPKSPDGVRAQQNLLEEGPETKPFRALVMEERIRLQKILDDPVFRQAWVNAQIAKPSILPAGLDSALGLQIGNNRLHQLQGWEMFRVALLRQVQEPRVAPPKITDTYPDSGTIEADAANQLKK